MEDEVREEERMREAGRERKVKKYRGRKSGDRTPKRDEHIANEREGIIG